MKDVFAIFNTDEVNRAGDKFTVSALEDGLWQAGVLGVPTHLGHDIHRPIGWALPFGLYFTPKRTYTVGQMLFAETEQDCEQIGKARAHQLYNRIVESIAPHKEKFTELLGNHKTSSGEFLYTSCASYRDEGITSKMLPLLSSIKKDDDGLFYLEELLVEFEYLLQGVFKHRKSELVVFAHPFFRRSLSRYNNFHFIFLDELMALHNNDNVTVRVALDEDMVGYAPSNSTTFEYEYWWGPKYTDDISRITPELTVHGSSDFERLYFGVSKSEFVWRHSKEGYVFEMEEVKDDIAPTLVDTYGCRYIHSIYDDKKGSFNHFDGAIRAYDSELMIERIDTKMTDFGRRSKYTKLFRIDGILPLSIWKSLVSNYLQGNPHIHEYFGADRLTFEQIEDAVPPPLKHKLVPYSIEKGEGIRMLVTYHTKSDPAYSEDRVVSICDRLDIGNKTCDALEYDVLDFKKALARVGGDLYIPENVIFLCPEDLYCNMPCILHCGDDTVGLLRQTLAAVNLMLTGLAKNEKEGFFSFTFAWPMEDKEVRLSILGSSSDILSWLTKFPTIPIERKLFKQWLEKQAEYLFQIDVQNDFPIMHNIINRDGVLFMKRRNVLQDVRMEINGLRYNLKFRKEQQELMQLVSQSIVLPILAHKIDLIVCEEDGLDYKNCPHSTMIDGTTQSVRKFTPLAFLWSDKCA